MTGAEFFPLLNASLNFLSGSLLFLGLVFIRQKNFKAHQKTMISAFLVSAVFLGFYLYYHSHYPPRIFAGTGFIRPVYFAMLISHIILAVGVLPFILRLLWAAHKGDFTRHKKLARVVYPVWIYTSLTGVLVYLFLYQWFTNEAFTSTGGL